MRFTITASPALLYFWWTLVQSVPVSVGKLPIAQHHRYHLDPIISSLSSGWLRRKLINAVDEGIVVAPERPDTVRVVICDELNVDVELLATTERTNRKNIASKPSPARAVPSYRWSLWKPPFSVRTCNSVQIKS